MTIQPRVALVREVSSSIANCELTHLEREPIDLTRARSQHHEYTAALSALGCKVHLLPELAELPDAVFVEDVAIVLDEVAILTRPGAESRQAEVDAIAAALSPYREIQRLQAPATLDGGDVLRVGRTLFVGATPRTNGEGTGQLRSLVEPFGYTVVSVPVHGCLHLKSGATEIAPNTLVVNSRWLDTSLFVGLDLLEVDACEPWAANVLRIDEIVLAARAFPRTNERMAARGIALRTVAADELAKAEGGLTCCSLIFSR
mgnify:CR=1 FL=1